MKKWAWIHNKIVYIAATNLIWRVSGGMSESHEFQNKYVIIVAAIFFGAGVAAGFGFASEGWDANVFRAVRK